MIQWYPGHMAKAKRILKDDLKLVDIVIEVADARVPLSSLNPDLRKLINEQSKVTVLNKKDLADSEYNKKWINYFEKETDEDAVLLNSLTGEGVSELKSILNNTYDQIASKLAQKGRNPRRLRAMIIGIPNVGKSALINLLAGSKITTIGNKPGVTKGRQWVNVSKKIRLLDTPGILWPKFSDEDKAYKLALTGAVDNDIFDAELAAYKLIDFIIEINEDILLDAYELDYLEPLAYDILADIGRKRGCLMTGGKVDRNRAARVVVNDFRDGKLGRITLEKPSESAELKVEIDDEE
ncbi:50S ribosomal subunit maturation GTPase RbgA (B. subtilis YlqF) [Halanaerobium saccharolyticum subsp. saccharolyticum DSM 6643]|uniref:Ribosome biogenesis GTPase A n=1 Tax=Halanaerobium saccharolyticum subsp. saccharolyticum DSM 6643 TaxID=1293054 RepID=M5E0K4_9FIRM|nr:ribosome biogenesis GTPase YlqF [Halanaerobium saccharolyticum]CCU79298.1 50S ribosomal subunit maturation GTPase RbgA (B. subtilis YlqF) [Halanaerobium saccharolyticum subsp. saccharolyticum DSM 6643]